LPARQDPRMSRQIEAFQVTELDARRFILGTMANTLSVVLITLNEALNLPRTLRRVSWAQEIIVVDSGSTDDTVRIARAAGARVVEESWKGFAAQKNQRLRRRTATGSFLWMPMRK